MMKYYFRSVGSFLGVAFLIAGIFLVRDGMTHSTATNSFVIFAGSAMTGIGMILLGLLWEPSQSARGPRRPVRHLEMPEP